MADLLQRKTASPAHPVTAVLLKGTAKVTHCSLDRHYFARCIVSISRSRFTSCN